MIMHLLQLCITYRARFYLCKYTIKCSENVFLCLLNFFVQTNASSKYQNVIYLRKLLIILNKYILFSKSFHFLFKRELTFRGLGSRPAHQLITRVVLLLNQINGPPKSFGVHQWFYNRLNRTSSSLLRVQKFNSGRVFTATPWQSHTAIRTSSFIFTHCAM